MPAERPLGVAEHFMWLMNQNRPTHSATAVEVAGPTEVHEWRMALNTLQRRHALLGARIRDSGNGPRLSFGHAAQIPLRVTDLAATGWQHELATEMRHGVDAAEMPPVRAVLLYSPERCALVLVAHHAVVDGLSQTYLVRDLLTLVIGGSVEGAAEGHPGHPVDHFLAREIAAAARTLPSDMDIPLSDRPGTYRTPDPDAALSIDAATLSRTQTAALRERTRAEGTTVHGAVAAAALGAAAELNADWSTVPLRVHSPLSLRGLLPAPADGKPPRPGHHRTGRQMERPVGSRPGPSPTPSPRSATRAPCFSRSLCGQASSKTARPPLTWPVCSPPPPTNCCSPISEPCPSGRPTDR
ncbi:condensation domain-containing protein [Streptomyces canus]|uniref:condensation domain-containing protein n=1 Tax=Streptomyces canus TaxID=58343 RepID=UPI003718FA3A